MVGLVNMICCGKVLCNVIHSALTGWWEIPISSVRCLFIVASLLSCIRVAMTENIQSC